jgi:hypothetical protein
MTLLRLDGVDYDDALLSDQGQAQLASLRFVDAQIADMKNMTALLTRAKKSYVYELKNEIIKAKSGVDLSALFAD